MAYLDIQILVFGLEDIVVLLQLLQKDFQLLGRHLPYASLLLVQRIVAIHKFIILSFTNAQNDVQICKIVVNDDQLFLSQKAVQIMSSIISYLVNYMKLVLFLSLSAIISCLHISSHFEEESFSGEGPNYMPSKAEVTIVGGFNGRDVVGRDDLSEGEKAAEQFIQDSLPEIKDYNLVHVRGQVVAGMNYCFGYKAIDPQKIDEHLGKKVELCVWSKPWENNFLAFQTPDGRQFMTGIVKPEPALPMEDPAVAEPAAAVEPATPTEPVAAEQPAAVATPEATPAPAQS